MSVLKELRVHAPFTIFGALTGVILIAFFLAVWLPCCVSDIVFPLIVANREMARETDVTSKE